MDIDLSKDAIGEDDGNPVYLQDIWPSQEEVAREIENALDPEIYKEQYADVYTGNEQWNDVEVPSGDLYEWDPDSTYIQEPTFFKDMGPEPQDLEDIEGARVLVKVGDSVTTDHISPAGAIPSRMPAGQYLIQKGVDPRDFNSYGSRRGNHEVMVRGTFGNIRLATSWWTKRAATPSTSRRRGDHDLRGESEVRRGERAAYRPGRQGVRVRLLARLGGEGLVPAGGAGRYRGELRAHPPLEPDRHGRAALQYAEGESAESLGLSGRESFDISGLAGLEPGKQLTVKVKADEGEEKEFEVKARVDSPVEVEYLRNGGILQTVLRQRLE